MTDDKKTLKFQMMMSPTEAKELDDWMFANRIRSRAEAIRRLCQMAMVVDKELDEIVDHAEGLREVAEHHHDETLELVRVFKVLPDDPRWDVLREQASQAMDVFERANTLHALAAASYNRIIPFVSTGALSNAKRQAAAAERASQKVFDALNAKQRRLEENRMIAAIFTDLGPEARAAFRQMSDDEQEAWLQDRFAEYRSANSTDRDQPS